MDAADVVKRGMTGNRSGCCEAAHSDGGGRVGLSAVAELAVRVQTPALRAAICEYCAGMRGSTRNRGGGCETAHSGGGSRLRGGAIAELAAVVIPPALRAATGEYCAAVTTP